MREATALKVISSPASIMGNKPHEEGAFTRSPSLPYFFPRSENSCSQEETFISCLS
jgi:hypothetical protein